MMAKKILFTILCICLFTSIGYAQKSPDWDTVRSLGLKGGKEYDIESGTGFFVNQNIVVTNEHVLRDCLTISVRGAVEPSPANLIATDPKNDLALLYVENRPGDLPYLRANGGLEVGDTLYVMGYPLERGETGKYLLVRSKVVGFEDKKNFSDAKQIEFYNSVEHGNSGGPLLDKNGNVVGVVVAKKFTTIEETNLLTGKVENKYTTISSIAISLNILKKFLQKNKIHYFSTTTYDIYQNLRPDLRGRDYVVNIHCVKDPGS